MQDLAYQQQDVSVMTSSSLHSPLESTSKKWKTALIAVVVLATTFLIGLANFDHTQQRNPTVTLSNLKKEQSEQVRPQGINLRKKAAPSSALADSDVEVLKAPEEEPEIEVSDEVQEPEVQEPEVQEPEAQEPEEQEPEVQDLEVQEESAGEDESHHKGYQDHLKKVAKHALELTSSQVSETPADPEVQEPEVQEPEVLEPEVQEPEEIQELEVKEGFAGEDEVHHEGYNEHLKKVAKHALDLASSQVSETPVDDEAHREGYNDHLKKAADNVSELESAVSDVATSGVQNKAHLESSNNHLKKEAHHM